MTERIPSQFIQNHLPHPANRIPLRVVRFGLNKADNQSAGKLRLGFQPRAAAQTSGRVS
jgi:hypothetical protein